MDTAQFENAFLISAAGNLKTGNMMLDMFILSLLTPCLIYIVKRIVELLQFIGTCLVQFFQRKPPPTLSKYLYTMNIHTETKGQADGLLNINSSNETIIRGLSMRLMEAGCFNSIAKTNLKTNIPSSYDSYKSRMQLATFQTQPEVPVTYMNMEFTFTSKSSFESNKEKPTLQSESSIEIKYNDYEVLMKLLNECKREQIERDYPDEEKLSGETHLYVYKMIESEKHDSSDSTQSLLYHKIPFTSERDFSSLMFDQKEEFLKTLNHYVNRTGPWEKRLQRPHKLVILLFGAPGCGKSSIVKALANTLKLHIVIGNMKEFHKDKQLQHFFFDQRINYTNAHNGRIEMDFVQREKCVILLEDLDAADCASWLKQRKEITEKEKEKKAHKEKSQRKLNLDASPSDSDNSNTSSPFESIDSNDLDSDSDTKSSPTGPFRSHFMYGDSPTLSGMLNALDGILELGSIVIITTNNADYFDKALLRPGRIDCALQLGHVTKPCMIQYLKWYYQLEELDATVLQKVNLICDNDSIKLSAAELQEMCQYADCASSALDQLEKVLKSRTQKF